MEEGAQAKLRQLCHSDASGLWRKRQTVPIRCCSEDHLYCSYAHLCLEVMHLMGISPAVLVTAGGVGAVASGFGAKGIVSNSLSGLSLYVNRPFVVSDFIDILSKNLFGM
ncbi:mechanosensitive ion channel domain-containing protein [Prochlorococcus marinus]|uniref:mechanosensitive ion channel domain-containing protein n=1 Tax=Prochlorococcus marinus TaxID=1219 RepID=UPI002287124F|nr:mechanosensitive ion channel domain-containing protein [Prochlorococcus marinus]